MQALLLPILLFGVSAFICRGSSLFTHSYLNESQRNVICAMTWFLAGTLTAVHFIQGGLLPSILLPASQLVTLFIGWNYFKRTKAGELLNIAVEEAWPKPLKNFFVFGTLISFMLTLGGMGSLGVLVIPAVTLLGLAFSVASTISAYKTNQRYKAWQEKLLHATGWNSPQDEHVTLQFNDKEELMAFECPLGPSAPPTLSATARKLDEVLQVRYQWTYSLTLDKKAVKGSRATPDSFQMGQSRPLPEEARLANQKIALGTTSRSYTLWDMNTMGLALAVVYHGESPPPITAHCAEQANRAGWLVEYGQSDSSKSALQSTYAQLLDRKQRHFTGPPLLLVLEKAEYVIGGAAAAWEGSHAERYREQLKLVVAHGSQHQIAVCISITAAEYQWLPIETKERLFPVWSGPDTDLAEQVLGCEVPHWPHTHGWCWVKNTPVAQGFWAFK